MKYSYFCSIIIFVATTQFVNAQSLSITTKRKASYEDIMTVGGIYRPSVSPDGKKVIYTHSSLDSSRKKRSERLRLLDLDGSRKRIPLTNQADDRQAAWSPDGKMIAFLHTKNGSSQVYVMSADGGDAKAVSSIPDGVNAFKWSPDSRKVAISTTTHPDDGAPALPEGVQIFTHANYRTDNYYSDFRAISRILVVSVDPANGSDGGRFLTSDKKSASFAFWSMDSKRIYFTYAGSSELYYGSKGAALYQVGLDGKPAQEVHMFQATNNTVISAIPSSYLLSPDATYVAYSVGNPKAPPAFAQADVFTMELSTGKIRNLTENYDYEVGTEGLFWRDSTHLIGIAKENGNAVLVSIDIKTGQVEPWWTGERSVLSTDGASTGSRVLAVASDYTKPQELYDVSNPSKPVQLTDVNGWMTKELDFKPAERVSCMGADELTIHGFLYQPNGFDPAQKYPVIVRAHGGPYWWWNSAFSSDVQAMTGAGYFVLCVNPRGSMSYGQRFASALNDHFPGGDFEDVMKMVDEIVKRPYIDSGKLGITGSSAGGILTDWAITHTSRFKAAVSISDIADFSAFWFVGDQPYLIKENDETPWNTARIRAQSPITYWKNITTPTMFISGSEDFRTPSSAGGEMLFRTLKYLRIPTVLVRFKGAGHSIYGSPDARHYGLTTYYTLRWMNDQLKGIKAPELYP